MASASGQTFEDLLIRIEQHEHGARRRTVLYSLVPVAVAAVILGYTAYHIQEATLQVQALKAQAGQYQGESAQYKEQIPQLTLQVQDLRRQADQYKEEAVQYKEQIPRLQARIADLEEKRTHADTRLQQAMAQVQDLRRQADRYEREAVRCKARVTQL